MIPSPIEVTGCLLALPERTYTTVCLLGNHSTTVAAPSRLAADAILRRQGWTNTRAGWVCEQHRRAPLPLHATWRETPPWPGLLFRLDDLHIASIGALGITEPESAVGTDQRLLQMRYQVAPMADASDEPSVDWKQVETGTLWWRIAARDDVGTLYEIRGGASGVSGRNGDVFDSSIDFEPAVPYEATTLEICFYGRYAEEAVFTLTAPTWALERPMTEPDAPLVGPTYEIANGIVGQRISRVHYVGLPIHGEDSDPSDLSWDYGDWHRPVMGVELEMQSGRLFHFTWGGQFRLTFAEGPMDKTWPPPASQEPLYRSWEVTRHPRWRAFIGSTVNIVSVATDTSEGARVPVAVRLQTETEHFWIVAAMPRTGPTPEDLRARDVDMPADEVIVLFSDERAARLGLSLPEMGSQ